jgi:DNA-binding response OmpR family regulator
MGKKILIVDDDELVLKSVRNLLQKHDWFVDICSDPIKALEKVQEGQYDCLLLDVRMPQISGPELLERVRNLENQGKINSQQVIFLTGYADESAHALALQYGAFNYLYKPFDGTDLVKCLENCLSAKKIVEANNVDEEARSSLDEKYDFLFKNPKPDSESNSFNRITLESIGAKINSISPGELFWWYAKSGFFYPSKKRKLTPFLPLVEENWRKALTLGEEIFWIATVSDPKTNSWASICNWRTTFSGWVSQHLVGAGHPAFPLMLMLGTEVKVSGEAEGKLYSSFQNWYRPTNKYANRVFGLLGKSIREDSRCVKEFLYFMINPKILKLVDSRGVRVVQCTNKNPSQITEYLKSKRGELFVRAEEYDGSDIELEALNEIYQKAGLQRKRIIFLAFNSLSEPVGALIAYKAPIGINFSMLENRCELILSDGLEAGLAQEVCSSLLQKAVLVYEDFPAQFIPLVTEKENAEIVRRTGSDFVRSYNQFIWTRPGYDDWYNTLLAVSSDAISRWKKYKKNP